MKALISLLAVLLMLSSTSLAQTARTQQDSKPEATGQSSTSEASPTASTPPAEADVPAAAFAPGAKLFLEPMDGFEQLLADEIAHKKVPVVLVHERAAADFVVSGGAHVKKPNFIAGMVLSKSGGANVSFRDAHTGDMAFACNFRRVDSGEREGDILIGWAGQCAQHLKKAMKKATEKK